MGNDEHMIVTFKAGNLEAEGKEGDLTASIQSLVKSSLAQYSFDQILSHIDFLRLDNSHQRPKFEVHKLIICGQSGQFSQLFKHN